MCEGCKQLWLNVDTANLIQYNARVHKYSTGNSKAAELCDREAENLAEEHTVEPLPGGQLCLINELTPAERQIVDARMNEQKLKIQPLPASHRRTY